MTGKGEEEMTWNVKIIEMGTHKVIKEIVCHSEIEAERVELGVLINLNRNKYCTQIQDMNQSEPSA